MDIFLACQEDSYMGWKSPCFMFILIMPYEKVHCGDTHAYSVLWYAPCDTHKQSYYGLYERVKLSLCTPWWYKQWAEVSYHLFSTSATDGSKTSASNSHHFTPRERAPGIRKLGQPQRWFGHFEKEKISCLGREWTPLLSSLLPSPCAHYTMQAPCGLYKQMGSRDSSYHSWMVKKCILHIWQHMIIQ